MNKDKDVCECGEEFWNLSGRRERCVECANIRRIQQINRRNIEVRGNKRGPQKQMERTFKDD